MFSNESIKKYQQNLGPALVVVLISIPLSMGIAIASGLPPVRGLITAIVGGLIIGRLAGSPLQISGPSAGPAVMVLEVVQQHGLAALPVVVLLMGVLQLSAGMFRLGRFFRAVSPAVINGMLAGIGALILSAQFHVMVDDSPKGNGLQNLLSIPEAIYKGLIPLDGSVHHRAAQIGMLTLAVLVGMRALRLGWLKKIPAPLMAVTIATVTVIAFDIPIRRVQMPASLWAALAPPATDAIALLWQPAVWVSALALAFAASAETLLCATAVDAMSEGPRTDYDRELFAQGVGNLMCGAVGAMPTSGVITRSTANVQAGATGRESAILSGAFLLIIMLAAPSALQVIPRASLAGLLVYIGFKLIQDRPYAEMLRYGRSELAVFVITVSVIVTINLLTGIVVGMVLATGKALLAHGFNFHRLHPEIEYDEHTGRTHVHLRGAASFASLPKLAGVLEKLPQDQEILLHVDELEYIDHACIELLDRWQCERVRQNAPVRVHWQTLHRRYHAKNTLDPTPDEYAQGSEADELLLEFLTPEHVLLEPRFDNKWHAIRVLSRRIAELDPTVHANDLQNSARARERESSTCLGHGLMAPHGQLPRGHKLSGLMALSRKGWDFGADDGVPVHCVLLLATPIDEASQHLAVLGSFARRFMAEPDLISQLPSCEDGEQVIALLRKGQATERRDSVGTEA